VKGFLELLAARYIAGTDRSDAIEVVRRLNGFNIPCTIDNLGENVESAAEAEASVAEYRALLSMIKDEGVDSTVSMKLTHLGLDVSEDLAEKNAALIIEAAAGFKNFVRIDMEGSAYTQRSIDIFLRLRERFSNVGVAIQSCLLRSNDDIKVLMEKGASIRLVKGAYKEPPEIAFEKKEDVDKNFSAIMRALLLKGDSPAIATHDEGLINEVVDFVEEHKISIDSFEFQMILGIKRTLQKKLAADGYNIRVYVPYGANWLPFITRRIKERRENLLFVIKNILD
jgi:proline dehydrogenase